MAVGMNIDIASIDMVSEVNMVSTQGLGMLALGGGAPSIPPPLPRRSGARGRAETRRGLLPPGGGAGQAGCSGVGGARGRPCPGAGGGCRAGSGGAARAARGRSCGSSGAAPALSAFPRATAPPAGPAPAPHPRALLAFPRPVPLLGPCFGALLKTN